MVSACHDFSDASNVINCIWGAVTTCVTAAGALWGATKGIGKIQTWANNNGITFGGFKRDTVDAELLDAFSSVLNTPVTHLGVFNYAPLGLNGTFGKRESVEPIDVFGFTSPEGLDMNVSFLGLMNNMGGSGKKQVAFKFGLGAGLASSWNNKRALFNEQYFTDGGIDFILDENPSDGAVLSTVYDYGQLNHEISCYMGESSDAAGHYFRSTTIIMRGQSLEALSHLSVVLIIG
ncbi:hypothetical protein DL95DRAFT_461323 [Leptodontidium sp. 2 PMI_412]|nr:hypothetical protein DL95DRAFT_461323 [Leptodontidium sp. 2 PMI_412]